MTSQAYVHHPFAVKFLMQLALKNHDSALALVSVLMITKLLHALYTNLISMVMLLTSPTCTSPKSPLSDTAMPSRLPRRPATVEAVRAEEQEWEEEEEEEEEEEGRGGDKLLPSEQRDLKYE